jgi:GGDEF domain-containing protein
MPKLTAQVRSQVHEALRLDLRIGTAALPEVETFDELVETAYSGMKEAEHKSEDVVSPRATSVQGQVTSH